MSRLLTNTENSLYHQYLQTVTALERLEEKATFTPLNEFEKEQLTQLEINLKRIKTKLILKGIAVES